MSKKLRTEAVDHLLMRFKPGKQRRMLYFFEDVCTVNETAFLITEI